MRSRRDPRTLLLELSVVAAVAAYYIGGNLLFEADRASAIDNARDVIALQSRAGLNWEPGVQEFFAPYPGAVALLVFFYAGPHFVLTYGFLVWAYVRRFDAYPYVRNAFALYTVSAFAFQWLFPVAPPRMVPELGLSDTVAKLLPINGETPWVRALVNDVAAVPSIHTGWSLLVALLAIRLTTSPLRWLWLVYPLAIMASVIATANHFVWDLITGIAWLGLTETVHDLVAQSRRLPRLCPAFAPAAAPRPRPLAEEA